MTHFLAKIGTVLGAFILILVAAGPCSATIGLSESTNQKKTVIHIGIYAPFTNKSAFIGRSMLGAMEIARDQLKPANIDYSFYTLDKMANSTNTAMVLQKFIEMQHIDVLLTEGTESGALVAPLAKRNNIIHFCLTDDSMIADGKNNFLAKGPNHKQAAVLTKTMKPEFIAQFKQEYWSHPITEAGYAFDIFHLLHNSIVTALKTDSNFSSQTVTKHLLASESGLGLMGVFKVNEQGVFYRKQILTA